MKKYPRIVQCDKRGQIVIPKDVRQELKIAEGTGFWMFSISEEGILLKLVEEPEIQNSSIITKVREKAPKIGVDAKNIEKSVQQYNKVKQAQNKLEEI